MKYEIEQDDHQKGWWIVRAFIEGSLLFSTKVTSLEEAFILIRGR